MNGSKLKTDDPENTGELEELIIVILIQVNTEDELSYVDRILYEIEFKLDIADYLDQREKQFDLKLNMYSEEE